MNRKYILNKLLDRLDKELEEARKEEPGADHVEGMFMFGRHEVVFFFTEIGCVLEINRRYRNDFVFSDNVAEYCVKRCVRWCQIDAGKESDDYDIHGFRDEADYVKYKFG